MNYNSTLIILDEKRDEILSRLSPLSYSSKFNDLSQRREKGTGDWILEEMEFRDWRTNCGRILWCPGMRGSQIV